MAPGLRSFPLVLSVGQAESTSEQLLALRQENRQLLTVLNDHNLEVSAPLPSQSPKGESSRGILASKDGDPNPKATLAAYSSQSRINVSARQLPVAKQRGNASSFAPTQAEATPTMRANPTHKQVNRVNSFK